MVVPPASGMRAMRPCCLPPIVVVSLPTHSPWLVAKSAWAPTPRVRPGFHDSGSPFTGSSAAMPVTGDGAGTGLVALEGVVLPAHVAADVDRRRR